MMGVTLKVVVLLSTALSCNGLTASELISHVAQQMREDLDRPLPKIRRNFDMDGESSVIIGAPLYSGHLPETEAILPGHTLIRPALGMLKSAVKFPHRDLENGAGVYGNTDNLGIRYDGKNERLWYSGFRRSPFADVFMKPKQQTEEESPRLRKQILKKPQRKAKKRILKIFPAKIQRYVVMIADLPFNSFYSGKKYQPKPDFIADFDNYDDLNRWSNVLRGRPNRNIKRTVDNKLYSNVKTFLYVKKLLNKLRGNQGNRRQDGLIVVKPIEEVDLGYARPPDSRPKSSKEISPKPVQKLKVFMSSQDVFNHKIYNADAPDHEDYLPIDSTDIKSNISRWWYYHQEDFTPFIE